ncbi:hypothetical protein A9Q79_07655 [Methylophaga sp. 42_25_T18]|nr:hypothetical protein A9Q79_07655 [Methylophaga sp. 42_25_T18]
MESSSKAGTTKIIYILYLVGMVMPILTVIGLVMAYVNRESTDDWLNSHFQFQIRTFWLGLLFSMISGLLTIIFIGYFFLLVTALWFIIRCVKGLKYLDQQQAHPNAVTWMID